eukprot:m.1466885 g.1466885  ORF g.1466885 m.1466885 type:complete len:117 (-) comp25138_c0_seq20:5137-5487(-)
MNCNLLCILVYSMLSVVLTSTRVRKGREIGDKTFVAAALSWLRPIVVGIIQRPCLKMCGDGCVDTKQSHANGARIGGLSIRHHGSAIVEYRLDDLMIHNRVNAQVFCTNRHERALR